MAEELVSPSGLGLRPCAYVLPIATMEQRTPPRGVAADRMAESGSRTDPLLVIGLCPPTPGLPDLVRLAQAALDHRA